MDKQSTRTTTRRCPIHALLHLEVNEKAVGLLRDNLRLAKISLRLPLFSLLLLSANACSDQAPFIPLSNISSIKIHRGWSGQSIAVTDKFKLQQIVDETNTLRQEPWQTFVGKPGACVMHVSYFANDERILSLIISAKNIIKSASKGGKGQLYLPMSTNKIPHLRALLISLGLPERCVW